MAINERDIFWDWSDSVQRANLARYVQENLNDIAKIVKEAEDDLKQIPPWHDPSFDAYVSGDPDRVRAQVKALFQRLQKGKPKSGKYLTYRVEPPDSPKGRQRLRLAREILHNGHSECMGWTLLLSACVLHIRLHPLIIVTRNKRTGEVHAMPGYWLAEQCFPQVVADGKDVEARLEHEIEVVNATRIAVDENGHTRCFEQAKEEAHERLLSPKNPDWEIVFAVDLQKAREEGINGLLPLKPFPGHLPAAEHFQWRPELEEIHKWWRDQNSYGVLALVGIGGAGKTALVHRFLAQLPKSDVEEKGVDKDETLPIPDALFVWSFHEHPGVDRCATALYNYLAGEQVNKATFEQVQDVLAKNWRDCRVLLVFDGVEKLQVAPGIEPEEEGGTFGQFLPEGAPLARFLSWCCDGKRPAHVLVTSRFGLTDFRRYEGYRVIDLRGLPLESARTLLRACGVKGLNWQLDELTQRFGNLALTLELLGNYIALIHYGEPDHVLSKGPPPLESEEVRAQTDKADTETLSIRLASVLRFYEEVLEKDDPAALGVLQRLCLFHIIPVDEELLAEIFSRAEESIAGPLAGLTPEQIRRHLLNLCGKYRLAYGEPAENPRWFRVHREIRDYFRRKVDTKGLHGLVHGYMRKLTETPSFDLASPWGGPIFPRIVRVGLPPEVDSEKLDLLEERIYHALRVDDARDAFHVFSYKLGGYRGLGNVFGEYVRGLRIAEAILERVGELWPHEQALLMNAIGLFSMELGQLDRAVAALSVYLEKSRALEHQGWPGARSNVAIAFGCLCDAWLLQGKLRSARDAAEAYFSWALRNMRGGEGFHKVAVPVEQESPPQLERIPIEPLDNEILSRQNLWKALAYRGYVNFLRGEVDRARCNFAMAERIRHTVSPHAPLDQREGLFAEEALLREGRFEDAARHAEWNIRVCQALGLPWTEMCATLIKVEACSLLAQSAWEDLRKDLDRVEKWAIEKAAIDLVIWHRLVTAQLELREFERSGDRKHLEVADTLVKDGLRLAESCGYRIYWIDLVVTKGEIWLKMGYPELALKEASRALHGDPALGMSGVQTEECGYKWGEGDALHLQGEALLSMGERANARQRFSEALRVRETIHDWKARLSKKQLETIERG